MRPRFFRHFGNRRIIGGENGVRSRRQGAHKFRLFLYHLLFPCKKLHVHGHIANRRHNRHIGARNAQEIVHVARPVYSVFQNEHFRVTARSHDEPHDGGENNPHPKKYSSRFLPVAENRKRKADFIVKTLC